MVNITRYDPFGDVFDDLLKGFLVRPVGLDADAPVRRLRIDVSEQNGEYKVLAELPGAKKDDIKVNIDGDQVSITAESRAERDSERRRAFAAQRALHRQGLAGFPAWP